jgi:hypothetical protein
MADPKDEQLDELEQKIEAARKQAEDHGTIVDEDQPDPTYEPADPVGIPDQSED